MSGRHLGGLLLIAVIWGASFLFIRILVDAGMGPFGLSAARTSIGLCVLLPLAWRVRRQFPRDRVTLAATGALGILNFAFPWTLFAWGQQRVESGTASVVNSAMPLWAAIISAILVPSDRLTPVRAGGLLLGFAGVAAVAGTGAVGFDGEALRGVPLLLAATLCYAVSTVSIRRWLRHVPPVALTVLQVGTASALLVPLALLTGAYDGVAMGGREWLSVAVLGGAGSGFAVVVYMWLIAGVGAVRASVATYMMPPIGVFLGWLVLDEAIGWNLVAGLGLIATGVALVQGLPLRRWLRAAANRPALQPAGE